MAFQWTCPHCGGSATIVAQDEYFQGSLDFDADVRRPFANSPVRIRYSLHAGFVHCPNPTCRQVSVTAALSEGFHASGMSRSLFSRQLHPPPGSRTFDPGVVPPAVIQDYAEACLIEELSPKAAATLCRRAMQGIIRDFFGVEGRTLYEEISLIEHQCEPLLWATMTAVRQIGNIGAHMEKDINVIVDVDPDEARALRSLIESMIDETYIARAKRNEKFSRVMEIARSKDTAKKAQGGERAAGD